MYVCERVSVVQAHVCEYACPSGLGREQQTLSIRAQHTPRRVQPCLLAETPSTAAKPMPLPPALRHIHGSPGPSTTSLQPPSCHWRCLRDPPELRRHPGRAFSSSILSLGMILRVCFLIVVCIVVCV